MAQTLSSSASSLASVERRILPGKWRGALVFALLLGGAAWTSSIDPRPLFSAQSWAALWDLLARLFPPELSPGFLQTAARATLATAATALVVTGTASALALPLGVAASAKLWRGERSGYARVASAATLYGLSLVRSVPDLIWALLFTAALGLGATAGTLALLVFYTALLARVYADIFDEADPRALEALESLSASRLQVFLFGVLPQSRALLLSYTLYSWECAVRSAAVLGFVGAGGLGYEISLSMRLFEYGQVFTLLACFMLLLLLVDALSRTLRGAYLSSAQPLAGATGRLRSRVLWFGVGAAVFALSLAPAGITVVDLAQADALRNALRFARGLLSPELSPSFLRLVAQLALQTVSISLLGTAFGALAGVLLALPATRLRTARYPSLRRGRVAQVRSEASFWLARVLLNLLRAVPELVWVLLCVVVVGFGPCAGVLALALHTCGVLGKLCAEAMEESPAGQLEAALARGAGPLQCFLWVLLPQTWPMLRRYVLLRWDTNLRAATILGLVGAGGIGQALYNDIQLGDYAHSSTLILAIMLLVLASDFLSQKGLRLARA